MNRKVGEFYTNARIVVSALSKSIMDFRRAFTTFVAVLLICLIVFVASQLYPPVGDLLVASRATPWGIVTAMFTHSDLLQIAFNMGGLFLFLIIFSVCNSTYHIQSKRKIETFLIISVFAFAIISNVLWIVFKSNRSSGASGMLYAVEGNLLGFSIANGWQMFNFSKFKNHHIPVALVVLLNVLISVTMFAQILLNPEAFLNAGEGLNAIAHGYSFLLGFLISVPWYYIFGKLTILY